MEKLQFKFLSSVKPIRPCIYYMLDGETKVIAVVSSGLTCINYMLDVHFCRIKKEMNSLTSLLSDYR